MASLQNQPSGSFIFRMNLRMYCQCLFTLPKYIKRPGEVIDLYIKRPGEVIDLYIERPGEVIDLLHVKTAVTAAAERHCDEDAVVNRRPRPSAVLQVHTVLKCSLKPSVLCQTQFASRRFGCPPLPHTLYLTTNRHIHRGSVIFVCELGQGGDGSTTLDIYNLSLGFFISCAFLLHTIL